MSHDYICILNIHFREQAVDVGRLENDGWRFMVMVSNHTVGNSHRILFQQWSENLIWMVYPSFSLWQDFVDWSGPSLVLAPVNIPNMSVRESFNPESYELDKNFRLTRFTELKGTGCKVPQDVLQKLLESLQENHYQEDEQFLGAVMPRLGRYLLSFSSFIAPSLCNFCFM